MTRKTIRTIQIVCFALSHIPMAAVLTILIRDGMDGDLRLIGLVVTSTLVAGVSLVVYLGYMLGREQGKEVGSPRQSA